MMKGVLRRALSGSSKFPLSGKVVAVGRNYADHAAELGNAVPKAPVLFLKPSSSYVTSQDGSPLKVLIPGGVHSLHHEVELGILIKSTLSKPQSLEESRNAIDGYVVALDMTDRQAQEKAKQDRLPWTLAKSLDSFTPLGPFISADKIRDHQDVTLWLKVNDQMKQHGSTKDMLFPIEVLLSYIAQRITLFPGDLVLTGTPSGVGPVVAGDRISCGVEGIPESAFEAFVEQGPICEDAHDLLEEYKIMKSQ
jgi:acylpyruvate hydrolase